MFSDISSKDDLFAEYAPTLGASTLTLAFKNGRQLGEYFVDYV
jgi:hypothetical protein